MRQDVVAMAMLGFMWEVKWLPRDLNNIAGDLNQLFKSRIKSTKRNGIFYW